MANRQAQEQYKIVDRFDSAYWSGQDVAIYANNLHLEEAIQINFSVSEQVRPYYSYSSYIADRVWHGARIIAGELTLNFKRDSYIYSLLSIIRESQSSQWLATPSPVTLQTNETYRAPGKYINQPWGPQTDTSMLSDPNIARKFVEAKMRDSSEEVVNDRAARNSNLIPQNFGLYETKKEGFDLNIILGGGINSAQTLRFLASDYEREPNVDYAADTAIVPAPGVDPSTGLKLIGTEIMSSARSMGDDGRSFVETYTFTARDVVVLSHREIDGPDIKVTARKFAESMQTGDLIAGPTDTTLDDFGDVSEPDSIG